MAAAGFRGTRFERQRDYIVPEYYTPTMQKGGIVGTTKSDPLKEGMRSLKETATIEDIYNGNLTDADYWQIASIVGDVAGAIGSLSGYGSTIGAIAGVAGTGAQLVSDIKRDGFDFGDIGSLALNLGLDAVTLIPVVGSAGQMAKIGKVVAKSAGLLKKLLMGVGAVRGLQGLTNIINGEGTLDDFKALSQGLLVSQRALKDVRNIAATKYVPKNAKVTPKTKEGIQKQYIEEFVAANKNKLGEVKGVNAEGKVTNLSEAKAHLKDFDGFSLPDKIASVQAAGSKAKGYFSSK